jgi:ribosome-binding factor A
MKNLGKPITQRQLRVGEMIKQALGISFMIRKVLSKKIIVKFLPKLFFVKDDSFDYAEKIENLIKQTNK